MGRDRGRGAALGRLAAVLLAGRLLAGCATETPEHQAQTQQDAARPVVCAGPDDCELKWGRALQWVLNHSAYKILTQSDVLITTMGPLANDPRPAFAVNKVPLGEGRYRFDFRAGCDNIFGCVPSLPSLKASFAHEVMEP